MEAQFAFRMCDYWNDVKLPLILFQKVSKYHVLWVGVIGPRLFSEGRIITTPISTGWCLCCFLLTFLLLFSIDLGLPRRAYSNTWTTEFALMNVKHPERKLLSTTPHKRAAVSRTVHTPSFSWNTTWHDTHTQQNALLLSFFFWLIVLTWYVKPVQTGFTGSIWGLSCFPCSSGTLRFAIFTPACRSACTRHRLLRMSGKRAKRLETQGNVNRLHVLWPTVSDRLLKGYFTDLN